MLVWCNLMVLFWGTCCLQFGFFSSGLCRLSKSHCLVLLVQRLPNLWQLYLCLVVFKPGAAQGQLELSLFEKFEMFNKICKVHLKFCSKLFSKASTTSLFGPLLGQPVAQLSLSHGQAFLCCIKQGSYLWHFSRFLLKASHLSWRPRTTQTHTSSRANIRHPHKKKSETQGQSKADQNSKIHNGVSIWFW